MREWVLLKMKLIIESWRKFVNESSDTQEISGPAARDAERRDVFKKEDVDALRAKLGREDVLDPLDPKSFQIGRSNPEALMPMYTVEEGGARMVIYKTFGGDPPKYFKTAI